MDASQVLSEQSSCTHFRKNKEILKQTGLLSLKEVEEGRQNLPRGCKAGALVEGRVLQQPTERFLKCGTQICCSCVTCACVRKAHAQLHPRPGYQKLHFICSPGDWEEPWLSGLHRGGAHWPHVTSSLHGVTGQRPAWSQTGGKLGQSLYCLGQLQKIPGFPDSMESSPDSIWNHLEHHQVPTPPPRILI